MFGRRGSWQLLAELLQEAKPWTWRLDGDILFFCEHFGVDRALNAGMHSEDAQHSTAWSTARHGSAARLAYYAEHIASDPNLSGVTTLAELHKRLSSLSAELVASDPASSVFKQLTFPTAAREGHPSPVFVPNRFKKDLSTDGVRIGQHYRYAVKAEEHAVQALEYACETVPSLILAATDGGGVLFHGGYRCVSNASFLRAHRVRRVVNTALSLGSFFVKFSQAVAAAEQEGVAFLHLGWVDSEEQEVEEQALLGSSSSGTRSNNSPWAALDVVRLSSKRTPPCEQPV